MAELDTARQRIATQVDREIVDCLSRRFVSRTTFCDAADQQAVMATTLLSPVDSRPISAAYRREIEDLIRTTFEMVVQRVGQSRHIDLAVAADVWSSDLEFPAGEAPWRSALRLPRWASAALLVVAAGAGLLAADRMASGLAGSEQPDTPTARVPALDAGAQDHRTLYRNAIANAALRTGQKVRLATINEQEVSVRVIRLTNQNPAEGCRDDAPESCRLKSDAWVSLPAELLAQCRGRVDALLGLRQLLCMPPFEKPSNREGWALHEFSVRRADLFRPCGGGGDVGEPECRLDSGDARKPERDTRDFVFRQMWTSHRAIDGQTGYPFTGMGWSYDWSPLSRSHIGVSEFIVREGAPIANARQYTPTEFCGSPM